jgi:hypothetical protein
VRSASLVWTVTCHEGQHHMPSCHVRRLRRAEIARLNTRLSHPLAAHTYTNTTNTTSPPRGATTTSNQTKGKQGLRRAKRLTLYLL